MDPITIKNKAGIDQVFKFIGIKQNNTFVFERSAETLVGRARIELLVNGNQAVNRVKGKLMLPSLCESAEACGVPVVNYTMVGSFDMSIVKSSTLTERQDVNTMVANLITSTFVDGLVVDGSAL